jgi:hypothetical protein
METNKAILARAVASTRCGVARCPKDHVVAGARELDFDKYSETGLVRILADVGGFDAATGAGGRL